MHYLYLTRTYSRIALLDKATNKVTTISLILVERSIIILIVDTIELRLWTSLVLIKDLDSRIRRNRVVTSSIISL